MKTVINSQNQILAIFDDSFGFNEAAFMVQAMFDALKTYNTMITKLEQQLANEPSNNNLRINLDTLKDRRKKVEAIIRKFKQDADLVIDAHMVTTDLTQFRTML